MSVKNALAIQRRELLRKVLDEFLSSYSIPSEYRVILPAPTQTILDAPHGYIGFHTHCFSLDNLRLPLNDFFYEAYDCEPSDELFHGFFNFCKAGSGLTFQKRSKKHIPSLLARVITRIEGWHQPFFFIQDTIVPSKFSQLLLKENMLDVKSFKDKLPSGIEQNSQFQRLVRYPVSARAFDDPILFLAGLREDDKDLTFLPKDFSPDFNTGSPYVSINKEPVRADKEHAIEPTTEPATEPVNERVGTIADLGVSPKGDTFVFHVGSVTTRIRERKCKTRGGSSRPPVKRKLASGSSTSRNVCVNASAIKDDTPVLSISDDDEDCLELKDATACHLKISVITSPTWKGFVDNHLDVELLDIHDRCYARQAIVDNAVNRRSCELLEVIEKLKGEADVMRARELAREEKYKGLWAKSAEAKEHKGNLDRLMLESQKWSGYQVSLLALESKAAFLEFEKANIEATKASLRQLVGKLVSSAITFGRCRAYEHVARMKNPFDLSKVKANASAFVEALLSKNPPTLQKHVPSRTQMHVPSSQLATPSSAPAS
nr:hypothetical protein [Tanacetum cinerariifolium]